MSTVAELLRQARAQGVEDAPLLLCQTLGKTPSWLFAWPEYALDEQQEARFLALLARRAAGEPLAYITGEKEFWSMPLKVTPAVLIPRPETERLVELALALKLPEDAQVLDLGTGSGAIALALSRERPGWQITATDASPAALDVARANARTLQRHNIHFLASDWYQSLTPGANWQLIVSNPPYVAEGDPHLQQDGLPHEPRQALTSGRNGLQDLGHIIQQAPRYLTPGGWLLVEHGYDQAQALQQQFSRAGFQSVTTHQDLAGQDRVTLGCYAPDP